MNIIIVEIPHRQDAFAWAANNWEDAADRSATSDGQTPGITKFSLAEALDMFEEDSEPVTIARKHGAVIEAQAQHDEYTYHAPYDAPSLRDVVEEWISSGRNSVCFLTSAEDFRAFLGGYSGHQANKAKAAAHKEAEALGWLDATQ